MSAKKYVHIDDISLDKSVDPKLKAMLLKEVKLEIQRAIKSSSKLTCEQPKEKDAQGLYIGGMLKVVRDDKSKPPMIDAKITMQLASWPKLSMFAFPTGKAKTEATNDLAGDVKFTVTEMLKSLMKKQIVPALEKQPVP